MRKIIILKVMKHTQGEWEVVNLIEYESTIYNEKGKRICEVKSFKGFAFNDPPVKEREANAKLIAAAPKMLQTLIDLKSQLIDRGFAETSPIVTGVDLVIKKATQ